MFSKKRRSSNAPPVEIGTVERAILQALHHYRLLEWRQIDALFGAAIDNSKSLAERIELLWRNAYIEEVPRPIYPSDATKGAVYRLGTAGATLLSGQLNIPFPELPYYGKHNDQRREQTKASSLFIEHSIMLSDVRIALEHAAVQNACMFAVYHDDFDIRRSRTWPRVRVITTLGNQEDVSLRPDGYFVLESPHGRAHFFLEGDRSTESIARRWQRKILGYKELVQSGEFHRHYGIAGTATPLRILTVTPSLARAENLTRATERYGPPELSSMFLYTPLSDMLASDALSSPIWFRPNSTSRLSIVN